TINVANGISAPWRATGDRTAASWAVPHCLPAVYRRPLATNDDHLERRCRRREPGVELGVDRGQPVTPAGDGGRGLEGAVRCHLDDGRRREGSGQSEF